MLVAEWLVLQLNSEGHFWPRSATLVAVVASGSLVPQQHLRQLGTMYLPWKLKLQLK